MSAFDIISGKSFASAVKSGNSVKGLYKKGVGVRYMSVRDQVIRFRLLPAFNPDDPNPETSIVSWVSPEGNPSDWLTMIVAAKFLGAKQEGREWCSIVSRETIGESNCIYRKLWNRADKDPEWKYLVDTGKNGAAILPMLKKLILMNIFDIDQQDRGAQVGEFTFNTAKSMFDPKEGFMWDRNPRFDEEVNDLNYMDQYIYGDLTCPQYGLVLRCDRRDGGQMKGSFIAPDGDENGRPYRWPVGEDILAGRQDLTTPASFVNIPEEEDLVNTLTAVLNQTNKNGIPEVSLLREVVGDVYNIPEPAPAPGRVNQVQGASLPRQAPPMSVPPTRAAEPPKMAPRQAPPLPQAPVAPRQAPPMATPPRAYQPSAPASGNKPVPGIPGEPLDDDLLAQLKARR